MDNKKPRNYLSGFKYSTTKINPVAQTLQLFAADAPPPKSAAIASQLRDQSGIKKRERQRRIAKDYAFDNRAAERRRKSRLNAKIKKLTKDEIKKLWDNDT